MSLASILAKMSRIPTNISSGSLLGMIKIKEDSGLLVNAQGEASVDWSKAPNATKAPNVVTSFINDINSVKRVLDLGSSPAGYVVNRILVAMNGSVLIPGVDYTATNGSTISIISSDGLDDNNVDLSLRDVVVVYHL